MTLAEIKRAVESKIRIEKRETQQKALLDYIHAVLVGRSVGRFLVKEPLPYPTVEEAYSSLFVDEAKQREEEKAKKQAELSALRFRQYAAFHNEKYKKEVANSK